MLLLLVFCPRPIVGVPPAFPGWLEFSCAAATLPSEVLDSSVSAWSDRPRRQTASFQQRAAA